MDNQEVFSDYCARSGLAFEEFAYDSPQVIVMDDGTRVSVMVSQEKLRLEACVGSIDDWDAKILAEALRFSASVAPDPFRACPVHFAIGSDKVSVIIVGEREQLDDASDFEAMLAALLSFRVYFLDRIAESDGA